MYQFYLFYWLARAFRNLNYDSPLLLPYPCEITGIYRLMEYLYVLQLIYTNHRYLIQMNLADSLN